MSHSIKAQRNQLTQITEQRYFETEAPQILSANDMSDSNARGWNSVNKKKNYQSVQQQKISVFISQHKAFAHIMISFKVSPSVKKFITSHK